MAADASGHPVGVAVAIGLLAGLVATQATNYAQGPLRRLTPDSVARREEKVGPGAPSSRVAAQKTGRALAASLTAREEAAFGTAIHLATGMVWGPVYGLLRRYGGLHPFGAALISGAAMSLVLDEGMVPVLGLSAPNRDYPAWTRVRGFLAHLVYGAAVASATEALGRLIKRPNGSA